MEMRKIILLVVRAMLATAAMLGIVYLVTGTAEYWQGWVFALVMGFAALVQGAIYALEPGLADARRLRLDDAEPWDMLFLGMFGLMVPVVALFSMLDAGRFGWSGSVPAALSIIAFIVFIAGTVGFLWPMWVNRWFALTVRIQDERGHVVVRSGPYAVVRHPGYAGAILMIIAMPLALGSLWGLALALVADAMLVWRTVREDSHLHERLPGYREYARDVRYRLLPRIW